ncbi:hypothetical protein N7539_007296 [Penicillium diatomitis]|uniref:Uncharacterized protein n=1 Tax=Penicillium diatomitis TaxID=2819901 RepID=A0A9W9WV98_9EURO|nr:uncharacterized protein N7539_007296 [Penicillium diatomitis]KAJ5477152.1 hypothetical protein N7539_007296 [Penicillium diatomitis]
MLQRMQTRRPIVEGSRMLRAAVLDFVEDAPSSLIVGCLLSDEESAFSKTQGNGTSVGVSKSHSQLLDEFAM